MAKAKLEIEIEVDDKGNVKIKNLGQELEKVESSSKKAGGAFDALGGSIQSAVGALSVGLVVKTTAELVNLGVDANRAEQALAAYAGSAEEAARTTQMVQDAAGGAISRLDAMQSASQLMAMGLATSAEEAAHLTEVAVTLGASMGRGPQESFQDFALLLANQSIPRLDTFGISSGRVRERILELQAANVGMSRETAFMTAVLEDADGKMQSLAEAGFEAQSSIDVLNARIQDGKIALGTWLADGLVPILDGFFALNEALDENTQRVVLSDISYEEYRGRVMAGGQALNFLTEEQFNSIRAAEEQARAMDAAASVVDGWAGSLNNAAGEAADLAVQTGGVITKVAELSEARLASDILAELNRMLQAGGDEHYPEYREAVERTLSSMFNLSEEEINAQLAYADLIHDIRQAPTDFEGAISSAEHFIERIERLQELAQNPIRFQIFTDTGVGAGGTTGGTAVDPGLQTENAGGIYAGP